MTPGSFPFQFDPNVDEQLKTEFMDELMTMRWDYGTEPCSEPCWVKQAFAVVPSPLAVPACAACPSRVAHDNVVQLLGACARPPKLCFVMELCGSSVYHLLHLTRTPLTAQQKASILVRARGNRGGWGVEGGVHTGTLSLSLPLSTCPRTRTHL